MSTANQVGLKEEEQQKQDNEQQQQQQPKARFASEKRTSTHDGARNTQRNYSISTDPTKISHHIIGGTKNLIKYENTYRMEPENDKIFNFLKVREHAKRELNKLLNAEVYDPKRCHKLCIKISDAINQEVKQLPIPRYKLITVVFMGEKKSQDLRIASRCLWDTRFDNCVTIEYTNKNLFAVVNIYGLYYE